MIFNGVKIEKRLGVPELIEANRFYLIEADGAETQFYISDSDGVLWLLNEGFIAEKDVAVDVPYAVVEVDNRSIFNNADSAITIPLVLPAPSEGLEFSFAVIDASGIRVTTTYGESIFIGDTASPMWESTYPGSFLSLRAIGGQWIALRVTGQWDTVDLNILTMSGVPVTFDGDALYI